MKVKSISVAAFLITFVLSSFPASIANDLKITVSEKRIRDLSPDGLTLVFYVNISNGSSRDYYLSGYEYRFVIDKVEYLKLQTDLDDGLKIGAKNETLVAFPVLITYANLFNAIPEMENERHAACNLVGWARFSDGRRERGKAALAFTGDFPIFRKPQVELGQLRVNMLTIGGADILFEAKFKNDNGFDLMVSRIDYTLSLAGYEIGEGTIPGDKNIDEQSEKLFSLPFLLDFFEVGKGVYDVLDKTSAQTRFAGEMQIQTVWGRLTIPFDIQDVLPISRVP